MLLCVGFSTLVAQETAPETNLHVFRSIAKQLAEQWSRATFTSADSVRLTIEPSDMAWYIENAFVEGLTAGRIRRTNDNNAPVTLQLGMSEAKVEYANIKREGLFGAKVLERTVRLTLDARTTNGIHVSSSTLLS